MPLRGLDHAVAARAQAARIERAQALLVLDQQDGALPGQVGPRLRLGRRRLGRAVRGRGVGLDLLLGMMPRQEDVERGALTGLGVDIDEAAGLLDDAVDRRQAEAGALADFLGREERLEDLVDDVGGNAGAGVGDVDPARSPPPACPCRRAGRHSSAVTLAVRTVSLPPSGIASRALTARLTITCSNCETSTLTGHRSRPCTRSSLTFSPISRAAAW